MNIQDLSGLGKPITRLIEAISQGVGQVSASYLTRRNADAKVYEIEALTKAISKAGEYTDLQVTYSDGEVTTWLNPQDQTLVDSSGSIADRAESRANYITRKEQENIERVTSMAALELWSDDSACDDSLDQDWVTKFFKYAQDVSTEEMQDLWGRLLAGEIRRSGSYSLRTLEFVRSMSQAEASMFNEVGKLAIQSDNTTFIYTGGAVFPDSSLRISESLQIELAELGLMFPGRLLLEVFSTESDVEDRLWFGEFLLTIKRDDGAPRPPPLSIYKFTQTGRELTNLLTPDADDNYLRELGRSLVQGGCSVTLNRITGVGPQGQFEFDFIETIE